MANTYTSAYTGAQIDAAIKYLTDPAIANRILIKAGDTVTFTNIPCSGYLSTNATNAVFLLPINKIILASNVTCSAIRGNMRHADGGYIFGSSSHTSGGLDWSSRSPVCEITDGGIRISLTMNTGQGTNNVPICADIVTITLTFS